MMASLLSLRPCARINSRTGLLASSTHLLLSSGRLELASSLSLLRRPFSSTTTRHLRTTELQPSHFPSLKCQPDRLWNDIHSTATFGTGRRYGKKPEQTGLSRLTLSDSDKQARDWFIETTKSLGCEVTIDSIGNIFAIRPGLNNDVPATFVGSHLDSQPLGGRFDGVLGVCAGIEMLRVLNDNWIETEGPVGVVNWTNEEGARFPISMMGSGVWAGARDLQATYDLQEVSSGPDGHQRTVKEELQRIDYLGTSPAQINAGGIKLAAHFELHIEQGPRLLNLEKKVAAVTGVQAYKWFEVHVHGKACHSGTTPMELRADPLMFAVSTIAQARKKAVEHGVLLSVGIIKAEPGSVNTVPDHVMYTLDIRAETDEQLAEFEEQLKAYFQKALTSRHGAAKRFGAPEAGLEVKETFHSPATRFDDVAVGIVEDASRNVLSLGEDTEEAEVPRMISGAGHDSVNTAGHCPTAMVFVPCRAGVSHHPEEWCEKEDCAVGTDVVVQSVLRFDRWRSEQGHFGA